MSVSFGLAKSIGKSLLGLIVSISILSSVAMAQELRQPKEPADFIVSEIVVGGMGTFLFGMMGEELLAPLFRKLLGISACPPFWANGYHICLLPHQLGWFIGISLGTSFVVIKVGFSFGVKGNVGFSFLGAAVGSLLALRTVIWVSACV